MNNWHRELKAAKQQKLHSDTQLKLAGQLPITKTLQQNRNYLINHLIIDGEKLEMTEAECRQYRQQTYEKVESIKEEQSTIINNLDMSDINNQKDANNLQKQREKEQENLDSCIAFMNSQNWS